MNIKSAFWRLINVAKLKLIGAKIGRNSDIKYHVYFKISKYSRLEIGDNFTFFSDCNLNPLSRNLRGCICINPDAEVIIGNNVGISASSIRARQSIRIGNRVTIGADCILLDNNGHSLDYQKRGTKNDIAECAPIVIGDDVLIGTRSIILKGVTIGPRTVIGSGSVVVKDIPADCIAAGNPCKVIRKVDDWSNVHRGGGKSYKGRVTKIVRGSVLTENNGACLKIDESVMMSNSNIWANEKIIIGKNTSICDGVTIIDSDCHSLDFQDRGTTKDLINKVDSPITIGCGVVIGEMSIINKGVVIGDNSIILPGSVVTKNIPSNCIAAGNPCIMIRKI